MRLAAVMVAALAAVVAGCGTAPSRAPVTAETAEAVRADVDAYLESVDPHGQVRAVLVHQGGVPVLELYRGGAGPDDFWELRSVTKSVMSALVGIAIDEGHISGTDATLRELLPSHADVLPPESSAVTLDQLLTHTGGFPPGGLGDTDFLFWTEPDWVRAILERRAADGPADGSFAYSDSGAHLLSAVLVEATGMTVLDFARANLFEPLDIRTDAAFEETPTFTPDGLFDDMALLDRYYASDFAWPTDPQGHHFGDSGIRLRPSDLMRFGELYLAEGTWQGEQVVPAAWVQESTAAHVARAGFGLSYGYQWWVTETEGLPAFAAIGRGGQLVEVVPDRDLVVVVATEYDERDPLHENKAVTPLALIEMTSSVIAPRLP